jgi:hypothetical protein
MLMLSDELAGLFLNMSRYSGGRRARWTLRLLENKVVELGIVDRASDSTIGRQEIERPRMFARSAVCAWRRQPVRCDGDIDGEGFWLRALLKR